MNVPSNERREKYQKKKDKNVPKKWKKGQNINSLEFGKEGESLIFKFHILNF